MNKNLWKLGASAVASAACLVALAGPASAATYNYDVEMVSGRISVGGIDFDTPGVGIEECEGGTTINGTINDTSGAMTGNLDISSPFVLPIFGGDYVLEAADSATGTYSAGSGTFAINFGSIDFTISEFDTSDCTAGEVVCDGTASLASTGGLYNGATLPLANPERIYVNASGQIDGVDSCDFPFNFFIGQGTDLSIGDNPNDDVPPTGTDPGAIFEQA
jgi:hypothetical protein